MKTVFFLFLSMFVPAVARKCIINNILTPRHCIDCKFVIFNHDNPELSKCTLFPKREDNNDFLVTGKEYVKKTDYYYCSTARNDRHYMCGKFGFWYQKSDEPVEEEHKPLSEEDFHKKILERM